MLRAVPQLQKLIRGWQFVYRDGVMLKNMHHRSFRRVVQAISKAYMRATIDDPALREKLTPDFEIGCKRILITSVWYPALNQPNVDLETSRDHRDPRARASSRRTAPSTRSTRSSAPPASTSPTRRSPAASTDATGSRWPPGGATRRRPTAA